MPSTRSSFYSKEITDISYLKYESVSILKDKHRKVYKLIKRSMKIAKEVCQCNQIDYYLSKGENSKKA